MEFPLMRWLSIGPAMCRNVTEAASLARLCGNAYHFSSLFTVLVNKKRKKLCKIGSKA
ncbi:hypothetical protein NXC12_CH00964 [Rhizobium etli]|uniref:Uncharacterized protein n=1 Tax=Rhizobium etli TaxID=29449 RepID=A0AAN1EIS0_RHIET|nr:hypothetical protein NXC12_CH00964 [Rhizobium etli]